MVIVNANTHENHDHDVEDGGHTGLTSDRRASRASTVTTVDAEVVAREEDTSGTRARCGSVRNNNAAMVLHKCS